MLKILQYMDGELLLAIQGLRLEWLDPLVSLYTTLGNGGILWIALSLAMLCYRPTRKAGVLALLAMLLGLLCTNVVLKHLVARPRPWLSLPIVPLVVENDPNSFPSGHTCAAFAAGMIWVRALPRRWMGRLAAGMAVAMGLSRLYVGVHYPLDVLAGALVGSLCAWAVWKMYRAREERAGPAQMEP